ncbi:iron-regulated protein A [Vibrio sp. 10N.222.52.B12]|uniref:imelysin family protein n=1 Tax=Vibrio sp. 10N.222.52.B12 TaxID=1880840 RepID=UPI000C82A0FF|nr:imelysin family protein [Vibrio sp. 10N.222.52.B12]PMO50684.1 iron-regulated protein A [Vibrio sp. 10N.222.52.B12]
MKKTLLVSAITATLSLVGCQSTISSSSAKPESTSHISQSVYEVEFQSAQTFLAQSTELEQRFADYCASESKNDAQVKQQWHQTMLSWMSLQGQERGPATALEQSWNVQFWPDKKNTTGRKMSVLTKSEQEWTSEQIATQSVTVQGLGALEWLIYDNASTLSTNNNTCATGVAIAENLHEKAQIIADSWAENPWNSLEMAEWESEYISLLSNQLEYSMKKLSRPLAKIGKPRPYFSESWRSETSLSNLKANLQGMEALYFANGNGLDALLREQGHADLADRVVHQFEMALETWPEDKSLFAALQTKEGYRMVLAQYNKLEQLKYLIHEEVAIELGVVIGFNATDGD